MNGIRYIIDSEGNKTNVVIDLKEHGQIVEDLREHLKLLGLDPSRAEEVVNNAQRPAMRRRAPTEAFVVQPQREWQAAKS